MSRIVQENMNYQVENKSFMGGDSFLPERSALRSNINSLDAEILKILTECDYSDAVKEKIIDKFRKNPTLLDLSNGVTRAKVEIVASSIIASEQMGVESEENAIIIDFYGEKAFVNLSEKKVDNMPDTFCGSKNALKLRELFSKILSLFPENHYLRTYWGFGTSRYSWLENGEYKSMDTYGRWDMPSPEESDKKDKEIEEFKSGKTHIKTTPF